MGVTRIAPPAAAKGSPAVSADLLLEEDYEDFENYLVGDVRHEGAWVDVGDAPSAAVDIAWAPDDDSPLYVTFQRSNDPACIVAPSASYTPDVEESGPRSSFVDELAYERTGTDETLYRGFVVDMGAHRFLKVQARSDAGSAAASITTGVK